MWYFTDCAVSLELMLLTQNHIVYLVTVFLSAGTHSLLLPWCLSTVSVSLNFLSNLLMLLVVHHLSRVLSSTVSHYIPLAHIIFYYNFIFVAENHIYKQCSNIMTFSMQTSDCQKISKKYCRGKTSKTSAVLNIVNITIMWTVGMCRFNLKRKTFWYTTNLDM